MPRVLLVYANPSITATPVPPYGMEMISKCLQMAGCTSSMVSPFVEEDPVAHLRTLLADPPDLIGFSIRNMDDALVARADTGDSPIDTTAYIDDIQPLVQLAVEAVGEDRVVLGGAGISAGPRPMLRALGARWAVQGPADDLAWYMGRALATHQQPLLPDDPRVIDLRAAEPDFPHQTRASSSTRIAQEYRPAPGPTPRAGNWIRLAQVRSGRVPVQISTGCDRRCHYCVEPRFTGSQVHLRPIPEIVAELDALQSAGIREFWLSCSELNVPNSTHATALFQALQGRNLDVQVFVQPAPIDDALLDAMEGAGLDPSDLSFEFGHLLDPILRAGGGPTNRAQIDALVELWIRRGYRTLGGSILLGGHPLENEETMAATWDAAMKIDAALPDGFGLAYAAGARVYPETPLADWVAAHPESQANLYTPIGQDVSFDFIQPVVHCRPWAPKELMKRTQVALANARGNMGPLNSEAPHNPHQLAAEQAVNRGIWRQHEGRLEEAQRCFETALTHAPDHLEALAQHALLCANQLGDMVAAVRSLRTLLAALPEGDPRHEEVNHALEQISQNGPNG